MFNYKLKASLLHFALSALLILLLIGTALFFWFPSVFLPISDFREVVTLIISVDLILGPLLTFVVFKPKKKSLKFDLSIIAIIQFAALFYGIYNLYQIHPVYITFNKDRFTIVRAIDATPHKALHDEYKVSKFSSGTLAFAKMPNDPKKQEELLRDVLKGGADLEQRVDYYEPYDQNINNIIARGLDFELIFSEENSAKSAQSFLKKYPEAAVDFAFLPLQNGEKGGIIVLDKSNAKPIVTINIDPWSLPQNNK